MAYFTITYKNGGVDALYNVEYASYTYRNGIQPSTAVLVCSDQSPGNDTGDLVISYVKEAGDPATSPASDSISVPDCIVTGVASIAGRPGLIQVTLLDRRWRWVNGSVDGIYNVRKPNDTYDYEQTPAQLMTLLLDAMGETGYTLTDVTSSNRNNLRPSVGWRADNPAIALDSLCLELGFDVTFDSSANVVIVAKGGGSAPDTTVSTATEQNEYEVSAAVAAPVPPEFIRVATGSIQFEARFKMKPGGIDTDGEVKAIADLSYKPAGGFDPSDVLADFDRVTGTTTVDGIDKDHKKLAKASVGRVWLLDVMVHDPQPPIPDPPPDPTPPHVDYHAPPGYDAAAIGGTIADIDSLDKVLPLVPYVNREKDVPGGGKARDTYKVLGTFSKEDEEGDNVTGPWPYGSSLDTSKGHLKLGKEALKRGTEVGGETPPEWADIYLTCVVVTDEPTNDKRYYTFTGSAIAGGSGTKTIEHNELEVWVTPAWNGLETFLSVAENTTEIDQKCGYYADAEEERLVATGGLTVGYEGIRSIVPNSLDRAIVFSCGSNALPRTTVYYATDPPDDPLTYDEVQESNARAAEAKKDKAEGRKRKRNAKDRFEAKEYPQV